MVAAHCCINYIIIIPRPTTPVLLN